MDKSKTYTIYCDGGARGNPGPAAYGFVVYSDGSKVYEEGKFIGDTTNNVAEYSAVIAALKYISGQSANEELLTISFILDSQLVAEQLSGRWKIKNENLRKLVVTVKELERELHAKISYRNVPREQNKEADRLVNLALDNNL